jgi:ATP adenylyltransferase/5',5'''-P-1,P-4-tetraphosphate phosphorylase II
MAAAEVYSPTAAAAAQQQREKATSQVWQAVVGWIGFLVQVLFQIIRGTSSCAQLFPMPFVLNNDQLCFFRFRFREMSINSEKCSSIHFFQSRLLGATKIVLSTLRHQDTTLN